MGKKIVVAMSGGVDSATTAALLKSQGHEVIGVTMQLWDYGESEGGCCSADEVCDARRVAYEIGIPHYVVNYMDSFKELVVSDFVSKYDSGETPIPCVLCNQFMKFDFLLKRALELDADFLATGHYARISRSTETGEYSLERAVDPAKDQSYFLFTLGQRELQKLIFPLGDKTKTEVRKIAESMGLRVATKAESMGLCFITGDGYREFLEPYLKRGKIEGDIVNMEGRPIAKHRGIASFTIGQRRGLGFAKGKPMYVVGIDAERNEVRVGEEKDLYSSSLAAGNLSWVSGTPKGEIEVCSKIRYRHGAVPSKLIIKDDGEAVVSFSEPQKAITPGQAIVFYRNEVVMGGGWIKGAHLQ
ncbi:MAG: tRNA 2-thiouridine(34) synthase MnmA [Candidatus Dadabacteria bacterium]|nr:tRNA 2-thiouridine(34) synthase MnmA [Candidatus Dadabacteria bacterium]